MWATVESIRTSTFFSIACCALISAACAQGTEIASGEVVVIQPLTPDEPDASAASADAGVATDEAEPAPPAP